MDFRDRMQTWQHTLDYLSGQRKRRSLALPVAYKTTSKTHPAAPVASYSLRHEIEENVVENEDCLSLAHKMMRQDGIRRPMVLIMADHRFAGGDVAAGSGAQEESLFRRTNVSEALRNDVPGLYPIRNGEAIVVRDVTVLKSSESDGCKMLDRPFLVDMIACPALHNPRLTEEGALREDDRQLLRVDKVDLVLNATARNGNDGLILGPMGCGAWRNPPQDVAAVMYQEISRLPGLPSSAQRNGDNSIVVKIACLEVEAGSYIVRNRDREGGASNYRVFRRVFQKNSRDRPNCGDISD